ncbi:MAG: PspC domain-containing protein [Lachnospiraceae bacterium]|jgi:phage shock protein C|nr:PspC domain-containing protein [Lachnospiraceae bacterium]
METRRLYRKKREGMICGVCAGIGDYIGLDPTVIRLVWALLGCTIIGIVMYFVAAVIIPSDPYE